MPVKTGTRRGPRQILDTLPALSALGSEANYERHAATRHLTQPVALPLAVADLARHQDSTAAGLRRARSVVRRPS